MALTSAWVRYDAPAANFTVVSLVPFAAAAHLTGTMGAVVGGVIGAARRG